MRNKEQSRANNHSWKRKPENRNRHFLSKTNGFSKSRNYGQSAKPDTELIYFKNILHSILKGFQSLEDKVIMANKVFEKTVGREIYLSSNSTSSTVIKALIGFTSIENLERFQTIFSANYLSIFSNKTGSYIFQKVMEISFLRSLATDSFSSEPSEKRTKSDSLSEENYNTLNEFSEEHRKNCSEFIIKTAKFLLKNMEEFMWDPNANHLIRTSILCLSGIYTSRDTLKRKSVAQEAFCNDKYDVPEEWIQIVRKYVNRLALHARFPEFPYNERMYGLMCIICTALEKIDKNLLEHFGKKILYESFLKGPEDDDNDGGDDDDNDDNDDDQEGKNQTFDIKIAKVFQTEYSVRLLQTLLIVAGPKLMTQLYTILFKGRMKVLALNNLAQFAVAELINNIKEKANFHEIFAEISDHIEEILRVGHFKVVSALSGACLRLATKQVAFVTAMANALHTTGSKDKLKDFFICVLKLRPHEIVLEEKTELFCVYGSYIVQNILQFKKPKFLISCILRTPPHYLSWIFSTSAGCFIADVFLKSKFIDEKFKAKLIRYLKGYYIDMASTCFGSRIVQNLFELSSDAQKCEIAKELSDKMNQLKATKYGRIVCSKLNLETY